MRCHNAAELGLAPQIRSSCLVSDTHTHTHAHARTHTCTHESIHTLTGGPDDDLRREKRWSRRRSSESEEETPKTSAVEAPARSNSIASMAEATANNIFGGGSGESDSAYTLCS